jgi:DeoR/GlpR family transcriptional regulator of sugar metabolism
LGAELQGTRDVIVSFHPETTWHPARTIERIGELVRLDVLARQETVTLGELRELTGGSDATVRRDLDRLEQHGLLERVRGGARLPHSADQKQEYTSRRAEGGVVGTTGSDKRPSPAATLPGTPRDVMYTPSSSSEADARQSSPVSGCLDEEEPLTERLGVRVEKKRRIGHRAARLCEMDHTVMIDGGSTTCYLAEALAELRLTVITNSFAIARTLFDRGVRHLIVPAGEVDPNSELIVDALNREFYEDYVADIVFLGVEGIDEQSVTNTDVRLIQAERRMIQQAKRVVVLADSSKFGRRGHIRLCALDQIDTVITDNGITTEQRDLLARNGVELIVS